MSDRNLPADKIVDVFVTGHKHALKMTLEKAHKQFVSPFFAHASPDDVWTAAQTKNGWEGTIDCAIVSILKADRVRSYDVVLR